MTCGVGHSHGPDLTWLWLWLCQRLAGIAPILPLAWEPPYATSAALKKKAKKKKNNPKKQTKKTMCIWSCMHLFIKVYTE